MAIPRFEAEYITKALNFIDENGVPSNNQSTMYELVADDGKRYPPKYVIAIADHLANGADISTRRYNSIEANNYLTSLGLAIEKSKKRSNCALLPNALYLQISVLQWTT